MVKVFFENLEIRDTSLKVSEILQVDLYQLKLIVVENKLDQPVNVNFFGKLWEDHHLEVPIANGNLVVQNNSIEYLQFADYFPYIYITAKCSTEPTSGYISAYLAGMPENKVEK